MNRGVLQRALRFLPALLLFLTACNEQSVRDSITQKQANEIVAALSGYGITASVIKSGRGASGAYSVTVKRPQFTEAVKIIQDLGLPTEPEMSLRELLTQHGLVPNPREIEALRVDRALSAELEELLENHPAVISARAVVRKFAAAGDKLGVSLVLRTRPSAPLLRDEVLRIVQTTIPGTSPESVEILSSEDLPLQAENTKVAGVVRQGGQLISVPLVPFLFWRVPEGDRSGLVLAFLGVLIGMGAAGAVIGMTVSHLKHRMSEQGEAVNAQNALKYERSRNELLEHK